MGWILNKNKLSSFHDVTMLYVASHTAESMLFSQSTCKSQTKFNYFKFDDYTFNALYIHVCSAVHFMSWNDHFTMLITFTYTVNLKNPKKTHVHETTDLLLPVGWTMELMGSWNLMSQQTCVPLLVPTANQHWEWWTANDVIKPTTVHRRYEHLLN